MFSIISPQNILLFLAAYLPFEPFLLKLCPDALYVVARYLPELLIYGLVIYVGILLWQKKIQYRSSPLVIPFVLLLCVASSSMIVNQTPLEVGLLGIRQMIRFLLVYFIVMLLAPSRAFIQKFLVILFSVALFQGLLGIAQSFIGTSLDTFLIPSAAKSFAGYQLTQGVQQFWEAGQRVTGTLGRYDQLGIFLGMILLIIAALLYENSKIQNVKKAIIHNSYFIILAIALLPSFLLSYSRAAWFGTLLGLFVTGYIINKDKKILYAGLTFLCLGMAYIGYSTVSGKYLIDVPNQNLAQRFFEAFSYERWKGEYDGLGRLYFAVHTPATVVASSPLVGVGPGSYGGGAVAALHYTVKYDELGLPFGIYGTDGYIDNNWFSLWGELGTLGLILYFFLIAFIFIEARQLYRYSEDPLTRSLALAGMGIIVAVSFQALLATYFEVRTVGFYLWLIAGIVASQKISNKQFPISN
ncbi:hypothetical protein HY620_02930 [Candidatus Uhrbacteria bacterium]|nr:hypothetical protein [Candidatus Uhrbacteria bacterium]